MWVIFKSKLTILPLFLILLSFGNIFNNFQFTLFSDNNKSSSQTKMLSYNVKNFKYPHEDSYENTKSKIVDFLINQKSDIVCLQEFHSMANLFYKPIKQIRDSLAANTYYYESYFGSKNNQLSGLVIFSKYKVVNKGKLKFDKSRTFCIYLDVIISNDTVRVFNTHLASIRLETDDIDFVANLDANDSKKLKSKTIGIYHKLVMAYELREKQMKQLMSIIEATKYKIILCGDFNDTPSSLVYNTIADKLNDAFVKKGMGISPTYAGELPLLRIDYVLSSKSITTVNYKKYKFKHSDHYPISAILEVN